MDTFHKPAHPSVNCPLSKASGLSASKIVVYFNYDNISDTVFSASDWMVWMDFSAEKAVM